MIFSLALVRFLCTDVAGQGSEQKEEDEEKGAIWASHDGRRSMVGKSGYRFDQKDELSAGGLHAVVGR